MIGWLPSLVLALSVANAGPATAESSWMRADRWRALPADGVKLAIRNEPEFDERPALRLDFDFQGRAGWAAARLPVAIELPALYELRFRLRGEGASNHLEVKLVDAGGENVWWHVRRDVSWPREWTSYRIKKRQVSFAWGPRGGGEPESLGALEIAVTAGSGGRGTVWISDLDIVATAPPSPPAGPPIASASSERPGNEAALAVDGNVTTAWRPDAAESELTVDLRGSVELGGLSLEWERGRSPRWFRVDCLDQEGDALSSRRVDPAGADTSYLSLPETEAFGLRLGLGPGACPLGCALAELTIRPLEFGASANAFVQSVAAEAERGHFPRGFSGEAQYWTVAGRLQGADGEPGGSPEEALMSEDGAVEVGERSFSLEPFVDLDGHIWTWADVEPRQLLDQATLPIPTVVWDLPGLELSTTVLPAPADSGPGTFWIRYRLESFRSERVAGRLLVALRPLQVNPPYQSLNLAGGVSPVSEISCDAGRLFLAGVPVAAAGPPADTCGTMAFDQGSLVDRLAAGGLPAEPRTYDATGLASAAMAWEFDLERAETAEIVVAASSRDAGLASPLRQPGAREFAARRNQVAARWRAELERVELEVPAVAEALVRVLRSSLAWILLHRDGPALQPGSRAYARSWIRDGALTGAALLRLGQIDVVKQFTEWFAAFQYPDGKVPCCVDRRGADPVAEHDSHGELIHLIAETYRYSRDREFAERLFPHVEAAVDHLESLRQQRRTEAYRQDRDRAFFGLLPESISHEGYASRPVHSYWDDTFAYRGFDDAVSLAEALDRPQLAAAWARRRDEFRRDLMASIEWVRNRHGLAVLPASADLADFDSTSTTTLLDPGGLEPYLPAEAVRATFERFWQERCARQSGEREWQAYTPYELRHVGAFVRLGWVERAHRLLDDYLADLRPAPWNAWPEVVTRDPRSPTFLGDLPHGWVASDYIRSVLDLFAYEDRDREALVLGAGIPAAWLEGSEAGVAVRRLGTPWGRLDYRIEAVDGEIVYVLEAGLEIPPGGLLLTFPGERKASAAEVDGEPQPLDADGRVAVRHLPAVVRMFSQSPVMRPETSGEAGSRRRQTFGSSGASGARPTRPWRGALLDIEIERDAAPAPGEVTLEANGRPRAEPILDDVKAGGRYQIRVRCSYSAGSASAAPWVRTTSE